MNERALLGLIANGQVEPLQLRQQRYVLLHLPLGRSLSSADQHGVKLLGKLYAVQFKFFFELIQPTLNIWHCWQTVELVLLKRKEHFFRNLS